MADSNVVTHTRFAGPDRVNDLVKQGVVLVEETRTYADIDLPEPAYGEEIVGELSPDERLLFFAMYDATREAESMTRDLMGRQIARLGETIRDSDRNRSLQEAVSASELEVSFESDEESAAFYRVEKLAGMLHANFHWAIAERLGKHDYVLGVRTRGRIVTVKRRY